MPATDNLTGRSIPPEKLTRQPAPSGKVKTLVNRVTEVSTRVDAVGSGVSQGIVSKPDLLLGRRAASAKAHQTINIVSYELQSNIDLVNGAYNNVPFNVPKVGGKGAKAGVYSPAANFEFRAPCERLGWYQVYFYLGLELPNTTPNIQQLIPMLYKNGLFWRAGDWKTTTNHDATGTRLRNVSLQMLTVVNLESLTDFIEPKLYSTGSGNQTLIWNALPASSSVYGYIDITYLGCSDVVDHISPQADSHPRI